MQLKLSIEVKTAQGRKPTLTITKNNNHVAITSNIVTVDVSDCDVVRINMAGKTNNDTVVDAIGNVVDDMAVILTGLWLGDVDFNNQIYQLPYYDFAGNRLPSNAYMSTNGYIEISIAQLVTSDFDYSKVAYMTLEEIAHEVLGRNTRLKKFNKGN